MFVLGLGFVISVLLGWAAHAYVDRNRISFFEKNPFTLPILIYIALLIMCNLCAKHVVENGCENVKYNY